MTLTIKQLLLSGHAERPAKTWPAHDGTMLDRTRYVSASEIGGCAREIVFRKKSPIVGEKINGFAERGHTAEAWIVSHLLNNTKGYTFEYLGEDQRSFYNEFQSGTPDGLMCTPDGEYILLEFKCIDPRTNWNMLPKEPHVTQVQQNIDLLMRCLDIEIEHAIIVYIDASNYENIRECVVPYNEQTARELRLRARAIMCYSSPEDANPEGVYNGGCKWCDYKSECSGAVEQKKRETEKLKGMNNVSTKLFS